ncbi:MAG: penicillin acylase family protein, partial [Urechidicola sp.]|nr:penicillin acylase family protein [Urechidicola sp.]
MNKNLLKVVKIFVSLIIVLLIVGYFFINSLKPTYDGTQSLNGLNAETTVKFDDYGIPHIYSTSEEDAVRTLGYVHAQDRLWQMELMSRIASGKLSEIFGEVALKNDKLFIGLGIEEASKQAIELLDTNSNTYKMFIAYLDGINQFIEEGPTPIEFYILGIDKQKFTIEDSYNIAGYMAFSFAMAHKTDPLLTSIQAKLGNDYLKELGLQTPTNSTMIENYNEGIEEVSVALNTIMENSPVPPFIGSNSWIVNAKKSKNRKVLFANDPHIGFSSPSVWYEAHLTSDNFESYGYYLAGIPFPLLSHNRDFVYGITMFENDDIDFYQEVNHPESESKYLFKNKYQTYTTVQKTIKVKDADDVILEIRSTNHGPIMNDLISNLDSVNPVSMSWIYTKMPIRLLDAFYDMSRAKNMETFEKAVSLIYAPGLNIMYGDAKGNISWWAAAQLYKISENPNRNLILDGASGKNEIEDYLFFNQNPQAHNPPWNYVYSANNQPDSIAGMLYPGYYITEDRAKRIVDLLEPKDDWSKEDFMKMITDTKSSVAPDLIKIIIRNIDNSLNSENEKEGKELLDEWNGDFKKSSIAATIYTKFIYLFLKNTYEDEMGEKIFRNYTKTHLINSLLAEQMNKETSIWWNNVNTSEVETRSDIIKQSFTETIIALENQLGKDLTTWTWNRVHTIEHQHPIGKVAALRSYFNVGVFEIDGTKEVINNLKFNYTND